MSAYPRKRRRSPSQRAVGIASSTDRYYEEHASDYFRRTVSSDMSHLYEKFMPALPVHARILDVGCGSGRDLRAFAERGFRPIGIDASRALVDMAKAYSGVTCYLGRMEEINYGHRFDAIWACASLIHVPSEKLGDVLDRLYRALVPGGVLFASVQEGKGSVTAADGRVYRFYQLSEFVRAIELGGFKVEDVWKSEDALGRRSIHWINVLARTGGDTHSLSRTHYRDPLKS